MPLTQLATDLKSADSTPTLSYIVADPCHDGSDTPCAPHAKAGPAAADAFLKSVVPGILTSPAYKADGLIAITYDQAPQTGPNADTTSCCGNPKSYPNLIGFRTTPAPRADRSLRADRAERAQRARPARPGRQSSPGLDLGNGQTSATGGGGQVGLLLLSQYVQPGVPEVTDYYNHYSLLASIEDCVRVQAPRLRGGLQLPVFGAGVWDAYNAGGF